MRTGGLGRRIARSVRTGGGSISRGQARWEHSGGKANKRLGGLQHLDRDADCGDCLRPYKFSRRCNHPREVLSDEETKLALLGSDRRRSLDVVRSIFFRTPRRAKMIIDLRRANHASGT
jgi:hypothetical protein